MGRIPSRGTTVTDERDIRISEIFGPTIQGEGALIGEPTIFVRTGGCDYRCVWCDTMHAVDSAYRHTWTPMTTDDVWAEVERLSSGTPCTVSLSGGNPAIQPFGDLIDLGHTKGYKFALETQGSVPAVWFAKLDTLVLSPKPPSSEMTVDWDVFDQCIKSAGETHKVLKIVIFDDVDYDWAKEVTSKYPDLPLYIQPGNHTPPPADDDMFEVDMDGIMDRMHWLVDKSMADQWFRPRILPQLHVLLWGNKRGV